MLRPNWNEHVNELSLKWQDITSVLLRNIYFVGPYLRAVLTLVHVIPSSLEL